jgi:hypothetical protein
MTNLHEINFGINAFCGPSVMSALTGKSTDECASIISAVSGRQEIRAVSTSHLIEAFKRLKFDMIEVNRTGYSLFANLNNLSTKPGMYIVMVPKHVVAVEVTKDNHLFLVDNHSKSPLPAEGSARLSQKCEAVYSITKKPDPIFVETIITVDRGYNNIFINATDIYNPETDNVMRRLGQFTFKNDKEVEMILYRLHCYYESGEAEAKV